MDFTVAEEMLDSFAHAAGALSPSDHQGPY
jgi:hypothetical protein